MIKDIFSRKHPVFSLEVFPPKRDDDIALIYQALDDFKNLNPDFISVTYGAGGSSSKKTVSIASYIQNTCGIEALAHFTCAALKEHELAGFLTELQQQNIKNILALRGDHPKEMTEDEFRNRRYQHASDLIEAIRLTSSEDAFNIAAACYPEKHIESTSREEDILHLKEKVNSGADFLITQLFFDNQVFYRFLDLVRSQGIDVPISVGIMPITSANQIKTIVELSGSKIPTKLSHLIAKYKDEPADLKKAGLDFATNQIMELLEHGVDGVHLYSMNKVDVATTIFKNLNLI